MTKVSTTDVVYAALPDVDALAQEIRKLVLELDDQVPVSDLIQHQFQTRFAKETIH